jgi:desumoylating isopeptidase 1
MDSHNEGWPVEVWIYDLSQGMARNMSMQLLGRHIEGVWHSSIVVYGEEYFYGGGISTAVPPGTAGYGVPLRKIELGRTQVPRDLFHNFLDNIREKYLPERYHLLDNNCNNFSNDVAVFLTGRTIPEDVRSLPNDVMSTPFGQMLRPMIDGMFQRRPSDAVQRYARRPTATPPQVVERVASDDLLIRHVSSTDELLNYIQTHKGVLVDFDSPRCGPCIALAPHMTRFAKMFSEILFCRVNVLAHSDIATCYNVRATPTILAFIDGKLVETVAGMNVERIEGILREMVESIKHREKPLHELLLNSLPKKPILFDHMQITMVFQKLRSAMSLSESQDQFLRQLERFLSSVNYKISQAPDEGTLEIFKFFEVVPGDCRFIVIDLMRMLTLNAAWTRRVLDTPDSKPP